MAELLQYAADEALNANDTQSLLDFQGALMPHDASIVEVVTDAWDENALTRPQALQKIRAVIAWIRGTKTARAKCPNIEDMNLDDYAEGDE